MLYEVAISNGSAPYRTTLVDTERGTEDIRELFSTIGADVLGIEPCHKDRAESFVPLEILADGEISSMKKYRITFIEGWFGDKACANKERLYGWFESEAKAKSYAENTKSKYSADAFEVIACQL